jgi:glycosyltransferase involved in cell wall biosynthesis
MKNCKITIVTPSFNQGKFIERAIKSIWGQEGEFHIQHIIADGGSIDETVEIIKKYEKLLDSGEYPIKCKGIDLIWWSKKDAGQADALNKAFGISTGDILGWLNSDDTFFDSNSLAKISSAFDVSGADIVVGNAQYVDENDAHIQDSEFIKRIGKGFLKQDILEHLYQFDFVPQPSTFFLKKVYVDLKIDKSLFYGMDWDLWIRAYEAGFIFYKIDEMIGNLRNQKNAKTVVGGINFYREKLLFYRKYKVWGLNRLYCYIIILKYQAEKIPLAGKPLAGLVDRFILGLGFLKKFFLKGSDPVG